MLPVNPATTMLFGLLLGFTGIAGLTAESGGWRIVCGVLLLLGVAETVFGIVWARSWYTRKIRGISDRQDDRQRDDGDDAWDDSRSESWDPGRPGSLT